MKHSCEDCIEPTKEIKPDGEGGTWISCWYIGKCKTAYMESELTAVNDYYQSPRV